MKISVKICTFVLALAAVFSLVGCYEETGLVINADTAVYSDGEDGTVFFPPGDTFPPEITDTMPPETTPPETTPPETTPPKVTPPASDEIGRTVYWVEKGEVWHTTKNCSSLSRSKNILSGSVSSAKAVGKDRVCKRCS